VMDYHCAKFGDFSFGRFGFIMRTNEQNHTHTHTHIYIYIYTERERERERDIYIYIGLWMIALLMHARDYRQRE